MAAPPRFLDPSERVVLGAVALLVESNPFLPERIEAERRVLGPAFTPREIAWHADATLDGLNPNLAPTIEVAEGLAPRLRDRLLAGARASAEELSLYESLVLYVLYASYEADLWKLVERWLGGERIARVGFWERFEADARRFLGVPQIAGTPGLDPAHLLAWGFQVRRAFHFTFRQIHGGSLPAAKLRAAVWESVFTADRRRYRRSLWARMGDVTTLVLGESGTGKELVARAIALSRYVPFDPGSRSFRGEASFHPVNLSALSPTLVESELFGHRRGAFTGALEDRAGYLESCPALGAVFLDEIGELAAELQVKLLRVLQERVFQRIGESRERRFEGKVVAATNRELEAEMRGGRFRPDLYYRLCADVLVTPTLRSQLDDSPGDLRNLLLVVARRIAGEEEGDALAAQAHDWIAGHLGARYPWPGNIRELEQCVRNVMVRGSYHPPPVVDSGDGDPFAAAREGVLTADELLGRYCAHVHSLTGSYAETARRLGLDRRTVRAKINRVRRGEAGGDDR